MPHRKQAKPGPSTPAKPKRLKQTTLFGYELSSSSQPSPSPSPRKKRKGKFAEPISPVKKTKGKKTVDPEEERNSDDSSSSSAVGGIRFEPEVIEVDDEAGSEEESPRRGPAKKRKLQHDDATDESESDLASAISKPSKSTRKGAEKKRVEDDRLDKGELRKYRRADATSSRRRRNIATISETEEKAFDEEEGEEVEEQPKRRRLVKGRRPSTPTGAEDDDSLLEEVDTDRIIEDRFRSRGKKSAFQNNLEKLKRKKRGQAIESSESSGRQSEGEDDADVPFEGARPSNLEDDYEASNNSRNDDEVEDSFIVEDDNQVVRTELPSEFSMNTFQDLAHHFKIICQLFVHVAVQPPHERHDYMDRALMDVEYFRIPLQIARRKLTGMRDSLVASSVWRPEFKDPLEKYPNLELVTLEVAVAHCDACHLGNRISTLLGRVNGEPYDKLGFEAVYDSDSDSDDSDDEDQKSKKCKQFNLGRFCARRTRVFHEFSHWEYATYQNLLREIDELRASQGKRGFIRVAFAGGVKPPKDLDDADGIMEWLDQRQIIEMEWRRVKDMMARARNLEMASKRGEED